MVPFDDREPSENTYSMSGTVYYDDNDNQDYDGGTDSIYANVEVSLWMWTGSRWIRLYDINTDASGNYSFNNLIGADYRVYVNQSDPQIDGYDMVEPVGSYWPVTLSAGNPNQTGVDFGFHGGSIGDDVWLDTSGDGIKDSGEPGISNVTVALYVDENNNGVVDAGTDTLVGTCTTSGNGTSDCTIEAGFPDVTGTSSATR